VIPAAHPDSPCSSSSAAEYRVIKESIYKPSHR
jgi:hypothetical protein